MARKTFSTRDENTFANKEVDLLAEGYRLTEEEDLKPGQYHKSVEIDHLGQEPIFSLGWEELDI